MKLAHGFETPLVICGPLRSPRQMLGERQAGCEDEAGRIDAARCRFAAQVGDGNRVPG